MAMLKSFAVIHALRRSLGWEALGGGKFRPVTCNIVVSICHCAALISWKATFSPTCYHIVFTWYLRLVITETSDYRIFPTAPVHLEILELETHYCINAWYPVLRSCLMLMLNEGEMLQFQV